MTKDTTNPISNESKNEGIHSEGPQTPGEFQGLDPEDYEPPQKSPYRGIARGAIALLFIFATIYLFGGVHEYFSFQETPQTAQAPAFESQLTNAETLTLPVEVYILNGGDQGSTRTVEDVRDLVADADEIWNQAAIDLTLSDIQIIEASDEEIQNFLNDPTSIASEVEVGNTESQPVKIVLTRTLSGINGVAFGGLDTVAVADYTTYLDFRVLAHEIGHVLSLDHDNNRSSLMYQGSRGMTLTDEEINQARNYANESGLLEDEPVISE